MLLWEKPSMSRLLSWRRELRSPFTSGMLENSGFPVLPHYSWSKCRSGSISTIYGSESFYHHAKVVRKTLIPIVFDFFITFSFVAVFGSGMGKNQDPGSKINIPDPQNWSEVRIRGSGSVPKRHGTVTLFEAIQWSTISMLRINFRYFSSLGSNANFIVTKKMAVMFNGQK